MSYAIGVPEPLSVFVDTYGTGKIPDSEILAKGACYKGLLEGAAGRRDSQLLCSPRARDE